MKDGKEQVEWEENKAEMVFMLRETKQGANRSVADVTMFIEGAETPQYAVISKVASLAFDFDRDNICQYVFYYDNKISNNGIRVIIY